VEFSRIIQIKKVLNVPTVKVKKNKKSFSLQGSTARGIADRFDAGGSKMRQVQRN
jgi:hypothetical protein